MNKDLELLEFLKYILGCTYISDLKTDPYNDRAKLLLKHLNLNKYSLYQINDAFIYLHGFKKSH